MHTQDNGRTHNCVAVADTCLKGGPDLPANCSKPVTQHMRGTQEGFRKELRSASAVDDLGAVHLLSFPGEFPRQPTGRSALPRGTRRFSQPGYSFPHKGGMVGRAWLSIGWIEPTGRRRKPSQPFWLHDWFAKSHHSRRSVGVSSWAVWCHALGHLQALLGWRSEEEPNRSAVRSGDVTERTAIKLAVTPLSSDPPAELHPSSNKAMLQSQPLH